MHDDIQELLHKDSFFYNYLEYTKGGESCPRFRLFTAISMLSSIVKRNVYIQRGHKDTFPTYYLNPWIVIVAPQGRGHKSSTLGVGDKLLKIIPHIIKPKRMAGRITTAGLINFLSSTEKNGIMVKSNADCFIYGPELNVFLDELRNPDMVPLLLLLYDCPDNWDSVTIIRGKEVLYNVCLTILSSSTPEGLSDVFQNKAFRIGLASRFIIVSFPSGWKKRVSKLPLSDLSIKESLINDMKRIADIKGEMVLSDEAERAFAEWYEGLDNIPHPDFITAYLERKQEHILKIASLLQLPLTYNKLVLEGDTLLTTLKIFDAMESDTFHLLEGILSQPKLKSAQLILDALREHKELTNEELLSLVWRSLGRASEFDESLRMLIKAKKIKMVDSKDGEIAYEYNYNNE